MYCSSFVTFTKKDRPIIKFWKVRPQVVKSIRIGKGGQIRESGTETWTGRTIWDRGRWSSRAQEHDIVRQEEDEVVQGGGSVLHLNVLCLFCAAAHMCWTVSHSVCIARHQCGKNAAWIV